MSEPIGDGDTQAALAAKGGKRASAWGKPAAPEHRWPAALATLLALAFYMTLPERLTLRPVWLVPALELLLIVPLTFAGARRSVAESNWRRYMAIVIIAILNVANMASLLFLLRELVHGSSRATGQLLLAGAVQIWLTNVIVYALWYWELDRGGPDARTLAIHPQPDFLFPQMVTPAAASPAWCPKLLDYVFVSFTNATAFSPTDTMPLTRWSKMLMASQAFISLITVAVVAARAVNILGGQ